QIVPSLHSFPTRTLFRSKQATPRYLVLDPPRVGFRLLNDYCQSFPSLTDILYITCDIASFSYDINKICKNGWRLVEVQPVDQFPDRKSTRLNSSHVKSSY